MLKIFDGATVLVTGHTGFKGSWLSVWLKLLGANVVGVGLAPPSEPSIFSVLNLKNQVCDHRFDIRERRHLIDFLAEIRPHFVFHLAAQSLVGESYRDPVATYETNVIGTLNLLEALRSYDSDCVAVFVTSDKSYRNQEWAWGYRETDPLGGSDPYSASKGAAEFVIQSHVRSFFQEESPIRIGVGRAGNVIGGGDWAQARVVPDCMRAWSQGRESVLRNPNATRPWQHVLEPLSGYLNLAAKLSEDASINGEAYNFGPNLSESHTVETLVKHMSGYWDHVTWSGDTESVGRPHEAGLLKLCCDKSLASLGWHATMSFRETVAFTTQWYRHFYAAETDMEKITRDQIRQFCTLGVERGLRWAK